jgi:hypothetical protein
VAHVVIQRHDDVARISNEQDDVGVAVRGLVDLNVVCGFRVPVAVVRRTDARDGRMLLGELLELEATPSPGPA